MIRPFTLLCFCAFAGAGAWLYQVKHSVALKDRELVEIRRQTEQARQRIDILRAEWALLNEPERLRQTAQRMLTLEPMQPQHFVRATEFERRLPGAVAFAGAPDLFAPPPVETPRGPQPGVMLASAAIAAPAARAAQAAAQPAPAPAPASTPAARVPEEPSRQALVAALAQQRADQAARLAAQQAAAAARPALPAPQPLAPRPAQPAAQPATPPAPAPRPIQPAVHVAPAPAPAEPVTRMTRATPAAPAEPVTRVARTAPPETTIASALGGVSSLGRPMLAPPVPVSPAAAATLNGAR